MKNKIIKILLLLAMTLTVFTTHPVYAETLKDQIFNDLDAKDPSQNASYWEPTIDNNSAKFESTVESLLGYINVIGIIISVITIVIVGIKYMLGSVEEKAEYKKTMMPYLVGCLFIFAISTIVSIIFELATKL